MANQNSNRLVRIINSKLDLQQLEAEAISISSVPVDLIDLLNKSVEKNEQFATQKQINILFMRTIDNAEVYIDSNHLLHALDKFISNAIKFTSQKENIILGIDRYGDAYRVSIIDFGQGITEEFKPRILEKFSQENISSTRIPGSIGLGLSMAKSILEKHNSELMFVS